MIQRFLGWVAQIAVLYPRRVIALVVIPQILIGFFVLQTPWDLSFGSLMNRHNAGVARYMDAIKEIRMGALVLIVRRRGGVQIREAQTQWLHFRNSQR